MIEVLVNDPRRSNIIIGDSSNKTMSSAHFPSTFRRSPNTQNSSAPSSPPAGMAVTATTTIPARSTSPMSGRPSTGTPSSGTTIPVPLPPLSSALTAGAPPPPSSTNTSSSTKCCDTGKPIIDPTTNQTICSCQYEAAYAKLAQMGFTGQGLPPGLPYPYPDNLAAYFPGIPCDQPGFYPNPAAAGLDLKEAAGATGPYIPGYPPMYDPYSPFGAYPFANGYVDLNGARRKNATRETTSTLKAWLNEHKKNPYPTKGEKIMLAIITKMTLTQVSTWFANARRRLKKENKMTWEPRNRVEDDDVNLDDDDHKSDDGKDLIDSKDSGTGSSEDGDRPSRLDLHHGHHDWNGSRNGSGPNSPDLMYDPRHLGYHPGNPLMNPLLQQHFQRHSSMMHLNNSGLGDPRSTNPDSNHNHPKTPTIEKPRIWSLADMASKENSNSKTNSDDYAQNSSPGGGGGGKLISPLAARGLAYHPYLMRPEYRNQYPSPQELAAIEQYHRQVLANNLAASSLMGKSPFTPLSLTASSNLNSSSSSGSNNNNNTSNNNNLHHPSMRASSPASSTSSTDREISVSDKPTALVKQP